MRHLYCAGLALCLSSSAALAGAVVPGEPSRGLPFALLFFGAMCVLGGFFIAMMKLTPKKVEALALLMALMAFAPALAYAQTATPSSTVLPIQWGDMANGVFKVAVEALYPVVLAAVAYAAGKLPWWVSMFLTTQRIDRALITGRDYALNAVEGATAGKALNVDVGYVALKVALERILGSTPNWLIKEMGGAKGITERLFRVFRFDETVSDKNTLSRVILDLPSFPFAAGK